MSGEPLTPAAAGSPAEAVARALVPGGFSLTPLWALYLLSMRQYLHGKRTIVVGLLLLVPAGLALLVRTMAGSSNPAMMEFMLVYMFIPQALLPLAAMIYVLGIIQDEQEAQTITYLLIRPISKWALYIVKLLATITMAVLLTAVATALTYAAIYVGANSNGHDVVVRCLKTIPIHALTVVAYCCLFGLISLLTNWPLLACILYSAVIEFLLANLPFGIRLITVIYYSRLIAYRTMSFVVTMGGRSMDVAAEAWHLDIRNDPKLLGHPQLSTCLIVLLGGSLVCAILAAAACSRREFYVKTPEQL